jgi:5S rRNA maturation endonuclease (ribonuclease M5)
MAAVKVPGKEMRNNLPLDIIRAALSCGEPGCACQKPHGLLHCPAHEDTTPSLSVNEQGGKILVKCHGGCGQDRVISALKEKGLWPSNNGDRPQAPKPRIVATYDYCDPSGRLVFQVCRQKPKGFKQRRPDGRGGWVWNLTGVDRIPYRLPDVLKAESVFICEGEKDCDRLAALGLTATTNPQGAGKWRKEYNQHFQGRGVIILPDNDTPGKAHAQDVARNLHGVAASVKVVDLPDLQDKGDVSDWLKAGGTKETLLTLAEGAPEFDPATAPAPAPETKGL